MSATATAPAVGRLKDVLPGDRIIVGDGTAPWAVVGRVPRAVAFPSSAAEVADLLALAREERWAVEPAGAGRGLRSGNPGRGVDLVVSTARMADVLRYEPGDLALAAGAGLPLDALARRAREERQWLAVDPPGSGGTLGALASTGMSGPLQAGYGQPRDLILGLDMVTGAGKRLSLGGGVVKNVAGFDLVRLVVGSRGTLGVVTSVTARLHPLPAADRTFVLEADRTEELIPVARRLAGSSVTPAALEVLERRAGMRGRQSARLAVRLHGPAARVEADVATLERAGGGRALTALDEAAAVSLWEDVRGLEDEADLVLRLAMPPASAGDLLHVARAVGRVRGGRDELERSPVRSALHVTSGVLRVAVPRLRTDSGWDERWAERLGDLRRTLEARGGSLTVSHAPPQVLDGVGAWGEAGAAARLMREIKTRFDPDGILAPGRFVVPDDAAPWEEFLDNDNRGTGVAAPSTSEDS